MTQQITIAEFKVDLHQLSEAAKTVATQTVAIRAACATISTGLTLVESVWQSPAGYIFPQTGQACMTQLDNMVELLQETVARMNAAYQTYYAAEEANFQNLNTSQN
jgi:hypothetical protein